MALSKVPNDSLRQLLLVMVDRAQTQFGLQRTEHRLQGRDPGQSVQTQTLKQALQAELLGRPESDMLHTG